MQLEVVVTRVSAQYEERLVYREAAAGRDHAFRLLDLDPRVECRLKLLDENGPLLALVDTVGDVAQVAHHSLHDWVVEEVDEQHIDPAGGAVRTQDPALKRLARHRRRHDRAVVLDRVDAIVAM